MILILALLHAQLHAKVIHQYFQKIESNGNHIGYAIIKEEHKADKNQIIVTSFVKTNEAGGNITEGIVAISEVSNLKPISYKYTLLVGETSKTIDAVVRKGQLYTTTNDGKTSKTTQSKISDSAFFSTFLLPKMLRKGLAVNKNYEYEAIAEEDAKATKGKVQILEITKLGEVEAYKLINEFKGNRFYSYVSAEGKVLKTESPITKLNTITVKTKKEAVANHSYPEVVLKTLFGSVP